MARKATRSNRKSAWGYLSYTFKDHDPILDSIDTLLKVADVNRNKAAEKSGVSITTLINWRKRKTKRPQFATVRAVVGAVGGDLAIRYRGKEM